LQGLIKGLTGHLSAIMVFPSGRQDEPMSLLYEGKADSSHVKKG
jgi:hypothetical protein